jgi:hypothetical protein
MRLRVRRVTLVAALAVGVIGLWPTVSASAHTRLHPVKCGAAWTFIPNGIYSPPPTPADYPGPATLTSCNQPLVSGGGGTLSDLLAPAAFGSSVSGTASVVWANGGTTAFDFTETTILPSVSVGPLPRAYRPCELGYPYITVVRITGTVTGNTVVGAGDPGVTSPVKALVCAVRGPGVESVLGFALAKRHTFQF